MALQSLDSDGVAVGERSDVVCCGLYLCAVQGLYRTARIRYFKLLSREHGAAYRQESRLHTE